MKRLTMTVAAAMLCAALVAEAQIYQWQDKNNKTVLSDRPPTSNVQQQRQIDAAAPPSGDAAAKSAADREMEFRKRLKESQDSAENASKDQQAAAERQGNCDSARRSLQILESGERVTMLDSKGERYYVVGAEREQQAARARQAVQDNCK